MADLTVQALDNMAKEAAEILLFRVRTIGDESNGYCYFDPIITNPEHEKYRFVFDEPWLYSVWDEPLLYDGCIVSFEIADWDTHIVEHLVIKEGA